MKIVVVDYGSGNLHSAQKAFERAAQDHEISAEVLVSGDPEQVTKADRIVLPGVGAFADCYQGLSTRSGLIQALEENVIERGRPFLGICVGMQLMSEWGLEKTKTPGLGWIKGMTCKIEPRSSSTKIPQIGWNTLEKAADHPLLSGIPLGNDGWHAYFVHSYHIAMEDEQQLVARCDYDCSVTAMVGKDNMVGTQFHPEKSQKLGLALIANFLRWTP